MSDNHTHTIHCDDESLSTNLRVEKSVDNHTPQIGEDVTWTIQIKNDGPGNATSVRLQDTLPPGVYHVSDSASYGDYDEATGEWYIGNVGPGVCHTLTIVTTVTDTSVAQVNSATVSTNSHETDYTDNNDTDWIHAQGAISDLKITKTVSNDQPAIGDQVSWQVTVTNEGPDAATKVLVKDQLPTGVTHISDQATVGEYDEVAGTWRFDQLASGESQTLTIVTVVDESTAQWNSATAVSDTYDSDWSDNTGHAVVKGGQADLSITKTVSNETPNLGEQVEWTIVVTNNGADKAIGVRVEDSLPGGLQHLSDSATTGYFNEYHGQWWIGELEAGASETLTITTNVIDAAETQVNTSTVVSDTLDQDEANNTATASTDAEAADLSVVKSVSDSSPNVGDTITWTVVVTNEGVDTAVNTVLHDALPNGVVYESQDATFGAYDNNSGKWDLGDLPSGASETLTIDTVVTDSFLQMNVAVVTSDTFDPDDCNNTDFAITDALPAADLAITKTSSDQAPNLGDVITWTIEVSNNGPDAASNVVVEDILPAGVTFQPDAASNELSAGNFNNANGTWTMSSLAAGATETMTLTTTVDSLELQVNTASVSSDTYDFNPHNNVDDAETDAVAADVQVTKVVSDEAPNLGDQVIWTIEVTNNGPDTASNIEIEDILPSGVTYIPLEFGRAGTAGDYNNAAGTWTLDSLAVGDTETLMLRTEVTSLDMQINTATVTSTTVDTDPSNNTDAAATDAVAADLQVTKAVNDEAPNLGDVITWTIEVTNNGPDAANNITVTEILPAGVTFIADASTNVLSAGTYNNTTGSWTFDSLAVGDTETLTLSTKVTSLDIQVNTAAVTSSTIDLDPSNNDDDALTDAVAADLQVTKAASDEAPNLGDVITWTVEVTNNGPDTANNIAVTEILPAGVTYVPDAATNAQSAGVYDNTTGSWTFDSLAVGDTETLTLSTEVTSLDIQVNTAAVTSSTIDLDPSNNDDDALTDAVAADLQVTKTVSDEAPNLGDVITWTIEVTNNGPDAANDIAVTELLPAGVTYVPDAATNAQSAGVYDNASGSWTFASLAVGATETLTISTEVTSLDVQVNTAEVTSSTVDLDQTNNGDDALTDPVGADLQITKVVSEESPALGDVISWTLEVTNLGPDGATQVSVTDMLPDGVAYQSATTATGTATAAADGTITWDIGDLAPNTPVTLTIETEVTSLDIQVNEATVTAAPGEELDTSNNTAEDQTDAIQVDLSVTNMANIEEASAGDTVEWTVTATNSGPDDATGVKISDLLPEGVEYVSAETATGQYAEGTGAEDGVWSIGDLATGETAELTITTTVADTAVPGPLTSVAEVIAQVEADLDSTPANDDGDQSEDDEAADTITIKPLFGANPNELTVEGSGGKSVNAFVVIDRSSSMKEEVGEPNAEGITKTRLDWNIEAVEAFAARTEVKAIKVIAFDRRVTDTNPEDGSEVIYSGLQPENSSENSNHKPYDEVSQWFDLSEAESTAQLKNFLLELGPSEYFSTQVEMVKDPAWGSGTNYQAAIDATMAQQDSPPDNGALETNYYFFSDGEPTSGGDGDQGNDTHFLIGDNNEAAWQDFAEANFDNTFAVGYAGATTARTALEQIAHINGNPDDPSVDDDPNLLLVEEVDAVPAVLTNFAATSVSGNAIADDVSENPISITSMTFDGVDYTYAGDSITASSASDATLTKSFLLVKSAQDGSLQFDFETGDFTYFSPTTDAAITESFDYTIADSEGMTDSSTVTINVTPSPNSAGAPAPSAAPALRSAIATTEDEPVPVPELFQESLAISDLVSPEGDDVDQILPTSPAIAKWHCADTELCNLHGPGEFHQSHLDSDMQLWENGISMY